MAVNLAVEAVHTVAMEMLHIFHFVLM